MKPEARIIADCIDLLEQAVALIRRVEPDVYASATPISPRGTIGGHVRHILDFYNSFLSGIESGRIDYVARERDPLVEQDPLSASQRISDIIYRLRMLREPDANATVLVSMETQYQTAPASCRSSVLRELEFLHSHTIHHYSLVAMLLRLHEIDPGPEFGVAPSTLNHWRATSACAQ